MILFLVLLLCSTSCFAMDQAIEGDLVFDGAIADGWSNASSNSLKPNEVGPHKKCYSMITLKFVPKDHDGDPYRFDLSFESAIALQEGDEWSHKTTSRKHVTLLKAIVGKALVSKIQTYTK